MTTKNLGQETEKIIVPREKVFQAISAGLRDANEPSTNRFLRVRVLLPTAVALFILATAGSGFVHPVVGHALSKLPLVGQIYANLYDDYGAKLSAQGKTYSLNESVTVNGITITIIEAYYQGNTVSIIGTAAGDTIVPKAEADELSFGLVSKKDGKTFARSATSSVNKVGEGYQFYVDFHLLSDKLQGKIEFPLEITRANGNKGPWKYSLSLEQKVGEVKQIDKTVDFGIEGNQFRFVKVSEGDDRDLLMIENNQQDNQKRVQLNKILDPKGKDILDLTSTHYDDKYTRIELTESIQPGVKYKLVGMNSPTEDTTDVEVFDDIVFFD